MNTVHVLDVCRAIWHLTTNGEAGQVYNLVDKSESSEYTVIKFWLKRTELAFDSGVTLLMEMMMVNMIETVMSYRLF